ncbi:MAG: hypothetical protein EBU90_07165 [Proteobacteria bacterium]|nr:hypothetical protein [Pseudomonadota bacterium]
MGTFYGPNTSTNPIVSQGLITYLDAKNPKSYPGTGTSWFDLSGNGRTASLQGSPTFNSDGTFSINGAAFQYVTLNSGIDYNSLGATRTYTIILTFLQTAFGTGGNNNGSAYLFHGTGSGYYSGYRMGLGNSGTPSAAFSQPHSVFYESNGSVAGNAIGLTDTEYRWGFVALAHNGSQATMFFNGQSASISTIGSYVSNSSDAPAKLGLANTSINWGVGRFNGRMGMFMLYNRVLTVIEMEQNYAAIRGRYTI